MSLFKSFYPVFHGFLLATSYAFVKYFDFKGSLIYLSYALLINCIILFLFSLFTKEKIIFSKTLTIKGVLFGITQLLIFQTLKHNGVANTMITAFIGSSVAVLLGQLFLNESFKKSEYPGYLVIIFGCVFYIFNTTQINYSLVFAFIAGITQGATFFLTRKVSLNQINNINNIIYNMFFGSGVILLITAFQNTNIFYLSIKEINLKSIFALAFIVLVAQFSLVYLMKNFNTHKASLLTLSRLPFSFVLDVFVFSYSLSSSELITTIIIFSGIFLSYSYKKIYISLQKV